MYLKYDQKFYRLHYGYVLLLHKFTEKNNKNLENIYITFHCKYHIFYHIICKLYAGLT